MTKGLISHVLVPVITSILGVAAAVGEQLPQYLISDMHLRVYEAALQAVEAGLLSLIITQLCRRHPSSEVIKIRSIN